MANSTDIFMQNFTLHFQDGTPFNVTISDLDAWTYYSIIVSVEYALQLGACLALFFTLVAITKSSKYRSPMFLLNAMALFFNNARLLLACLYFTGPFNEAYVYLSGDFATVPLSAYNVSISTEVLTVAVLCLVQLSLLFQTSVVCLNLSQTLRLILLLISSFMASVDVGWRLLLAVVNIKLILDPDAKKVANMLPTFESTSNIVTTVAIFWFAAVFTAKLGHAIFRRWKLGLRRWGSMEIIFTMSCHTLFIPALFSALQYVIDFPGIGSFVVTLVVIFLPLSSLWAATSIDSLERGVQPRPLRTLVPVNRAACVNPDSSVNRDLSVYTASDSQLNPAVRNDYGNGGGLGTTVGLGTAV